MRTRPRAYSVAVLGLILPLAAAAQTPDATTAPTIENLAWIAGTWATDLGDQVLEERWSPPMANAMTGSFRWSRDDEVWLYEFLLIEETDGGIFYYLRHFGPGSVGWEEREEPLAYRLDSLAPNRAEFASVDTAGDSFVFSREGDELIIEIISGDDVKRIVYTLQAETGEAEVEQEPVAEEGEEVPTAVQDAVEPGNVAQPADRSSGTEARRYPRPGRLADGSVARLCATWLVG